MFMLGVNHDPATRSGTSRTNAAMIALRGLKREIYKRLCRWCNSALLPDGY